MTTQTPRDKTYWRDQLTPEQYEICWCKGTEPPFTGEYTDCERDGLYTCVCCGQVLFDSVHKYHSGCGWPSFWQAYSEDSLTQQIDYSHGMVRVEVLCKQCGAHLGHVFEDGPPPTGLRFCINSVALRLKERP